MQKNYSMTKRKRRGKLRVKTKGIITGLLFAVFISLLALFIAIIPKSTTTASAADEKYLEKLLNPYPL